MTGLKKWVFRIAAVLLGLMPLFLVEGALQIAGYPRSAPVAAVLDLHRLEPLFVESVDGQRMEIAPQYIGLFSPVSFEKRKPSGTYRIFVLGGSTVQGRPYGPQTAFGNWLQLSLEAAEPERRWQVINCGGASYASYRIRKIMEEVTAYAPDLVILYTGHNEFLEDRKYADVGDTSDNVASIVRVAARSKLVQLFQTTLHDSNAALPRNVMPTNVRTRLDKSGGLELFERDAGWRRGIEQDFRRNLAGIIEIARRHQIPLVGCIPASNVRDTPPFKTATDPGLSAAQQVRLKRLLTEAQESDSREQRRALLKAALEIDPRHAGAAFFYGQVLLEIDPHAAGHWLQVAEDNDVCPLRMTSTMRDSARRIFEDYDVPTVDVDEFFRELSENNLPGDDLFVDHVHPTIESHQRIAAALFERLESLEVIQQGADFESSRREKYRAQFAELDEVYFLRARQRLEALRQWARGEGRVDGTLGPAKGWTSPEANRPSTPSEPR